MSSHNNYVEIKANDRFFYKTFLECFNYKDLFFYLLKRNIAVTYKQTILGPIWFVVQPLILSLVYFFVFNRMANLSTGKIPPSLFYISGTLLWGAFSELVSTTADTFTTNTSIFSKVYFPRLLMPLSAAATIFLKSCLQCFLLVSVLLYQYFNEPMLYEFKPSLFILALILIYFFAFGFGLIIASVSIGYKDLRYLFNYISSLLMYATPVFYSVNEVPQNYREILWFNPLLHIFEMFRSSFIREYYLDSGGVVYAVTLCLFVLITGILMFTIREKNFVDTI